MTRTMSTAWPFLGFSHSLEDIATNGIELGGLRERDFVVGFLWGRRIREGDLDLVLLLELRHGIGNLSQVSNAMDCLIAIGNMTVLLDRPTKTHQILARGRCGFLGPITLCMPPHSSHLH
jgi:hypothetical protein